MGRLLIAVGRAAPLSVAWLPLAGFLLPSSPLPQVALAVVAREVIGGSLRAEVTQNLKKTENGFE